MMVDSFLMIINKTFEAYLESSHPSDARWNFFGSLSEAGQDGGGFQTAAAFHLNETPFQHGREVRVHVESVAVFNVWKRAQGMDGMEQALFWKDTWRRSKSDCAIVIVRYNSVIFVLYVHLLHIDRFSRKAFASIGSSIFWYILTCQISFLLHSRLYIKKSLLWGWTRTRW